MAKSFQLTGASVIIYKNDTILLQQRNDNKCWGYAGGKIEIGEIVEEAAKREAFEETGIIVNNMQLFGVFSGPDLHHVYPDGTEVDIIDIVYTCNDFHGEIKKQDSEVDDLQWFKYNEIPEKISPPIKRALMKFIETHYAK